MTADLVFAPEPQPESATEPKLIDWAHRPADDDLARIIDASVTDDHKG